MPNPKVGTVTPDVETAVKNAKAGLTALHQVQRAADAPQFISAAAVAMELRLLRSTRDEGEELDPMIGELESALENLRELAHGIYPPLLEVRGLPDALAAACRRSANHVEPILSDVGRFGREVEAAVYFCAVEALANADKHAPGATVELELDRIADDLVLSVANDGSLSADSFLTGSGMFGKGGPTVD